MSYSLMFPFPRLFQRGRLSFLPGPALFLALIGLCGSVQQSKADVITIGVLSFDSIIPPGPNGAPGTNGFTIYNFTGSNSQPGTPDSPLNFLSTSLLLNGAQMVVIGDVAPGSAQPAALEFPTNSLLTDAQLTATLDTTSFTIGGQNYVATSDLVFADLAPSSPPDLMAGTDFVAIDINASPSGPASTPEPAAFWLALGPLATLWWLRGRARH